MCQAYSYATFPDPDVQFCHKATKSERKVISEYVPMQCNGRYVVRVFGLHPRRSALPSPTYSARSRAAVIGRAMNNLNDPYDPALLQLARVVWFRVTIVAV
jgi:hypothetical protein